MNTAHHHLYNVPSAQTSQWSMDIVYILSFIPRSINYRLSHLHRPQWRSILVAKGMKQCCIKVRIKALLNLVCIALSIRYKEVPTEYNARFVNCVKLQIDMFGNILRDSSSGDRSSLVRT